MRLIPLQSIIRHLEPVGLLLQENMQPWLWNLPRSITRAIKRIQSPRRDRHLVRKGRVCHTQTRATPRTETADCDGAGGASCRGISEVGDLRRGEMGPCLVGASGLFATLDTVAVDEARWEVGGCVANKTARAASSGHCEVFVSFNSVNQRVFWG